MKFKYGARVKIKSGFYEGSRGTILDYKAIVSMAQNAPVLMMYLVLVDTPEFCAADPFAKANGYLKKDFPEHELEAIK